MVKDSSESEHEAEAGPQARSEGGGDSDADVSSSSGLSDEERQDEGVPAPPLPEPPGAAPGETQPSRGHNPQQRGRPRLEIHESPYRKKEPPESPARHGRPF